MEPSRIPNRLKKYRYLAGLSQKQVAAIISLQNSSSLSRWEKGFGTPGIIYLLRLSFLYKTLPNHLYPELSQTIKKEVFAKEQDLLSLHEKLISNENCLMT